MSEAPNTCARCGGTTHATVLRGLPMDKCTQCGAVTVSEADLAEVVGTLDTEDAPTEWAPLEPATEVFGDQTQTSDDAPTTARPATDLPFDIESQPPPPRREASPEPVEFSAPPMLTEEFELPPNLADVDRTEEAPKLAMPVSGAAMMGEPQIDLSSLREASAPAPRDAEPGPESDFNDTPTRPAFPIEGTLEPADDVGPYLLHREEQRQTRMYGFIIVLAFLLIGVVGTAGYFAAQDGLLGGADEPSEAALSEVITSSNGRVAVEVEEPSVADVLPPEPKKRPEPTIKVSRAEPAPPTRGVVRRPMPVVVPVTAPTAGAAPAPAPAPPSGGSYSALVQKGWSTVSGDPASAASSFARALELRSGDPEASYGLGYALWRQERQSDALPHLCLALRTGKLDTQREVNGLLARSDLSCD